MQESFYIILHFVEHPDFLGEELEIVPKNHPAKISSVCHLGVAFQKVLDYRRTWLLSNVGSPLDLQLESF